MISDEEVRALYRKCKAIQQDYGNRDRELFYQFFRGKLDQDWAGHYLGGCQRDMSVFRRFNVIPEYCFGCYKVTVSPRTVMELFKLMMLFDKLDLPDDNTRKCMIETRRNVSGTYKGLIYCRGLDEASEMENFIMQAVGAEISSDVPVGLKRGCSEYSIAYPDYEYRGNSETMMTYSPAWRVYEAIMESEFKVRGNVRRGQTYNRDICNLNDADTMYYWLRCAATLGDPTYLEISETAIEPFTSWDKPSPFDKTRNP